MMTLTHYYDGVPTMTWRVHDQQDAAEVVRRIRGTKTRPWFTAVLGGYELSDGPDAVYELTPAREAKKHSK